MFCCGALKGTGVGALLICSWSSLICPTCFFGRQEKHFSCVIWIWLFSDKWCWAEAQCPVQQQTETLTFNIHTNSFEQKGLSGPELSGIKMYSMCFGTVVKYTYIVGFWRLEANEAMKHRTKENHILKYNNVLKKQKKPPQSFGNRKFGNIL